jgi:two-component system torCAD operon response regulator TorR
MWYRSWGQVTGMKSGSGDGAEHRRHILVVDDEELVRFTLKDYFGEEGFRVSQAESVAAARDVLDREAVDLILLDIRMPGEDGLSLAREVRSGSRMPIILLTGRVDDADKVLGLELGADDYVTKPFNIRELHARINSVLRRSKAPPEDSSEDEVKRFSGWTFDVSRRRLTSPPGDEVALTRGEFELLVAFVGSRNRVLSRDRILDLVSSRHWAPIDRTVDVMVRRLRRKLEADPSSPKMIVTVYGVGYRFAPEVT